MEFIPARFYTILKDKDTAKIDIFKKVPKKEAELLFTMDLIHDAALVGPVSDSKLFQPRKHMFLLSMASLKQTQDHLLKWGDIEEFLKDYKKHSSKSEGEEIIPSVTEIRICMTKVFGFSETRTQVLGAHEYTVMQLEL